MQSEGPAGWCWEGLGGLGFERSQRSERRNGGEWIFKKQLPDDLQKSLLALPFQGSRTSEGEHLIDQRLNPHATAAWCLHYLERKKCMGRKKTHPTH